MTKKDLICSVYQAMKLHQFMDLTHLNPQPFTMKEAERAVQAIFNVMAYELSKGKHVILRRFGEFKIQRKKERIGLNPKTLEHHAVPARTVVKWKASNILKEKVKDDSKNFS